MLRSIFIALLLVCPCALGGEVVFQKTPDGGIQPQAVVDLAGVLHLTYLKGDPAHCDIFYVRSTDGGRTFSRPMRVNSHPNSAIAIGTVRGEHLAIGKDGRPHVAWMGSDQAQPKAGPNGKATPMLYTRLNDEGTAFEPERNVITQHIGLDGGGSVAADGFGRVIVAWHAPFKPNTGEANRTVWLAVSEDDGKTFAPEKQAWGAPTGACGCCGMRIFSDAGGATYILYRTATDQTNRDMMLLTAPKAGDGFVGQKLSHWNIATCPMSTASMAAGKDAVYAAWENEGHICITQASAAMSASPMELGGRGRKHPSIAVGKDGTVLVAWAEGTGWERGGSVGYQLFTPDLKPIAGASGNQKGLPAWGLPSAAGTSRGFVIFY